jgi:hypothetical protein
MAARSRRKFLTPENIDGGATPAQTRDVGGGELELATLNPQGAVANAAPEKPVDERERLSGRLPPFKLERFEGVANCNRSAVEAAKLREILSLIPIPPSIGDTQRDALYVKAIDLFESIGPADGIEGMLAAQMVGTHNATMECLRRAMIYDQSLEAQKVYLSQAERLMNLYTRHVDALARHRGGGQPNITVGQVNVESGGRAIVGNVAAGAGSAAPPTSPPLIEGADAPPAVADLKKPTRRKARQ